MRQRSIRLTVLLVLSILAAFVFLTHDMATAETLEDAIAAAPHGKGPGRVDLAAEPGYLGIPGAPKVNLGVAFLWSVWVGWVFTTLGAFGGIMAGIGHMSVYGLGDYAKSFRESAPDLNRYVTNSIRVSNQILVGLAALVGSINYFRQRRLVAALGLCLGAGSLLAGILIMYTPLEKMKFVGLQGYFGCVVLLIGAFMVYELTPKGQARKQKGREAAMAFEAAVRRKTDTAAHGVMTTRVTLQRVEFSFFGKEFGFSPLWAFLGGFFISTFSSFFGIGGGFLYIPFLTSMVGLPMYVAAATSGLSVLISMIFTVFNFMVKGVTVEWLMIAVELLGIFFGAMIGPRTSKYIPEKGLTLFFIVLACYVGTDYILRGFFDFRILG